jgi:hypothetical protein
MPRPEMPKFEPTGQFIKDTSMGFLEFNIMLDKAEEDLRQCND